MTVDPRDLIPALNDRRETDESGTNREWSEQSPLPVEGADEERSKLDEAANTRREHDQNP